MKRLRFRKIMKLRHLSAVFGFGQPYALPDMVYRDLVDSLFTMRFPIVGMGLLFVLAGMLMHNERQDSSIALLTGLAAVVTAARFGLITAYRRKADPEMEIGRLKIWERLYALGSYIFAVLLAALSVYALQSHFPLNHLIVISLIFTFGAGIVSRIGARPAICIPSLLLATVPTIIALVLHSRTPHDASPHAEYFIVEAMLVTIVAALSLESVRHLYRSTVEHLTVKHDLAYLVRQDALTGLPNRLSLRERFHDSLNAAELDDRQLALHFLDLDGFKAINDCHGHLAGDAILREVASRLRSIIRSSDTVARMGGDEFVVIQADVRNESEAELLARRIIKQLSAPYRVMEISMQISVSIGIALAPRHGLDLGQLTACADAALYRSKNNGKAQFFFYTIEDAAKANRAVA